MKPGVLSSYRYSVLGNWGSRLITHREAGNLSPNYRQLRSELQAKNSSRLNIQDRAPPPGPDSRRSSSQPADYACDAQRGSGSASHPWLLPDIALTAIFNEICPLSSSRFRIAEEPAPKCRLPLRFQTKLCPVAVGICGLPSDHRGSGVWFSSGSRTVIGPRLVVGRKARRVPCAPHMGISAVTRCFHNS
jgi:hypothetical protein